MISKIKQRNIIRNSDSKKRSKNASTLMNYSSCKPFFFSSLLFMYRFLNYELMGEKMEAIKKLYCPGPRKTSSLPCSLTFGFVFSPRILVRNVLCGIADFLLSSRVVGRMRSLRHACHSVQPSRHVHNWFRTSSTFDNPINTVNRSVSFPSSAPTPPSPSFHSDF